ncbi:hypothetical protein DIPPA_13983 [Diplonema papillatum]|nr:hypothetical protein DIPPA_13983 [Diplonema papillatum]
MPKPGLVAAVDGLGALAPSARRPQARPWVRRSVFTRWARDDIEGPRAGDGGTPPAAPAAEARRGGGSVLAADDLEAGPPCGGPPRGAAALGDIAAALARGKRPVRTPPVALGAEASPGGSSAPFFGSVLARVPGLRAEAGRGAAEGGMFPDAASAWDPALFVGGPPGAQPRRRRGRAATPKGARPPPPPSDPPLAWVYARPAKPADEAVGRPRFRLDPQRLLGLFARRGEGAPVEAGGGRLLPDVNGTNLALTLSSFAASLVQHTGLVRAAEASLHRSGLLQAPQSPLRLPSEHADEDERPSARVERRKARPTNDGKPTHPAGPPTSLRPPPGHSQDPPRGGRPSEYPAAGGTWSPPGSVELPANDAGEKRPPPDAFPLLVQSVKKPALSVEESVLLIDAVRRLEPTGFDSLVALLLADVRSVWFEALREASVPGSNARTRRSVIPLFGPVLRTIHRSCGPAEAVRMIADLENYLSPPTGDCASPSFDLPPLSLGPLGIHFVTSLPLHDRLRALTVLASARESDIPLGHCRDTLHLLLHSPFSGLPPELYPTLFHTIAVLFPVINDRDRSVPAPGTPSRHPDPRTLLAKGLIDGSGLTADNVHRVLWAYHRLSIPVPETTEGPVLDALSGAMQPLPGLAQSLALLLLLSKVAFASTSHTKQRTAVAASLCRRVAAAVQQVLSREAQDTEQMSATRDGAGKSNTENQAPDALEESSNEARARVDTATIKKSDLESRETGTDEFETESELAETATTAVEVPCVGMENMMPSEGTQDAAQSALRNEARAHAATCAVKALCAGIRLSCKDGAIVLLKVLVAKSSGVFPEEVAAFALDAEHVGLFLWCVGKIETTENLFKLPVGIMQRVRAVQTVLQTSHHWIGRCSVDTAVLSLWAASSLRVKTSRPHRQVVQTIHERQTGDDTANPLTPHQLVTLAWSFASVRAPATEPFRLSVVRPLTGSALESDDLCVAAWALVSLRIGHDNREFLSQLYSQLLGDSTTKVVSKQFMRGLLRRAGVRDIPLDGAVAE